MKFRTEVECLGVVFEVEAEYEPRPGVRFRQYGEQPLDPPEPDGFDSFAICIDGQDLTDLLAGMETA